jgi:hypothetical protein
MLVAARGDITGDGKSEGCRSWVAEPTGGRPSSRAPSGPSLEVRLAGGPKLLSCLRPRPT